MDSSRNQLRAAVYCRISDDREGERLGVERQREDCMALADRHGWQVVRVFTQDNDKGASRVVQRQRPDGTWEAICTPRRPDFEDMLALAERREIDVIVAYSNSRLTRRMMELERLIQLHERTKVQIHTVVSGNDDLSTADGQMTAQIKASVDAAEAKRIGERVARAAKQRREQGQFHGGRPPYGYQRADKGKLKIDPVQAEVLREVAPRVLNGESLYGIRTDLNRRGIPTAPSPRAPQGTRWQSQTLKRVLTSPAAIGRVRLDSGELKPVAEPILDRATWDRLNEILFDSRRWKQSCPPDWSSRRKFALSGLLVCGACGHRLSGAALAGKSSRPSTASFACVTATGGCGRVRITYAPLESWVIGMVLARLDVPGVQDALSTREEHGDDDDLRQQIADDERRLEGLDDQFADGVLDNRRYRRQVERLSQRLAANRAKLAEVQRSTFVIDTNGRSLAEAWDEHHATWQRTLLGHVIDRIVIEPHPAGVPTTVTARRGEGDDQLRKRRNELQERNLLQRVHVS